MPIPAEPSPASETEAGCAGESESGCASELLSASGQPLPRHWFTTIAIVWAGQAFSILTSYAASFAAVWYVTETTGSALALSAMSICAYLPMALLAPFGGVIADRFNRKAVIMLSDLTCGIASLALGFLVLVGQASIPAIVAMVAVRAACQAFHSPAMMAAMPMLVPQKHLLRINTLDMVLISAAGIVTPALGIFLYTAFGFHSVLFIDFFGALAAVTALAFAPFPSVERIGGKSHVLADMKQGVGAFAGHRGLTILIAFTLLATVAFGPMGALYPLMTYGHFGGDGYMAAVVEAVYAGGMLVGSVLLMVWGGGKRLALLIAASIAAFGTAVAAAGLLPPSAFSAFAVLCAVMGFMGALFNSPLITLIQRAIPEDALGRAMGFITAAMSLTSPIGIAIGGAVAEATGVAAFFLIDGILCAAIGIGMYLPKSVRALDASSADLAGSADSAPLAGPAPLADPADPQQPEYGNPPCGKEQA